MRCASSLPHFRPRSAPRYVPASQPAPLPALRQVLIDMSLQIKRRASKSGSPGSSGQGRGPQKPQPAKRGNKRGKAATGNGGGNNKQQHNSAAAVQTRGQAGSKAPTHNSQHGSSSAGASGGSLSRGGLRQQGVSKGADPALAQLLTSLDLGRFLPQFVDEEMDMEAFGEWIAVPSPVCIRLTSPTRRDAYGRRPTRNEHCEGPTSQTLASDSPCTHARTSVAYRWRI
jgi:hypothetical protein|eukprot:SAG25_NODE_327_length_9727_cov_5.510283_4_plen_228_part_00